MHSSIIKIVCKHGVALSSDGVPWQVEDETERCARAPVAEEEEEEAVRVPRATPALVARVA